jgi:cytochrome c oxidase cbb3-type subunit 3
MHMLVSATPALALFVTAAGLATAQQSPLPPPVRYEEGIPAGGTQPPAATLRDPLKGDSQAVEEGRKLFGATNCDGCHAGGAVGAVGPSLADGRWRYGGSDGELYQTIFYGRPKGMPAFGGALPPQAIWRLVTYIQSLQPAKDTLSTVSWCVAHCCTHHGGT